MHHNCPYFHNADLIPEELRSVLEEELAIQFASGTAPQPAEPAEAGAQNSTELNSASIHSNISIQTDEPSHARSRQNIDKKNTRKEWALRTMLRSMTCLSAFAQEHAQGRADLSERYSHEIIQRIGQELSASENLKVLSTVDAMNRSLQRHFGLEAGNDVGTYPLATGASTSNAGAPNASALTHNARSLREGLATLESLVRSKKERERMLWLYEQSGSEIERSALKQKIVQSLRSDIDDYETQVYRTAMFRALPALVRDLCRDIASIHNISLRMEHYFGMSSAGWDLKQGEWQEIPWDIFNASRQFLEDDSSLRRLAEILGRGEVGQSEESQSEQAVQTESAEQAEQARPSSQTERLHQTDQTKPTAEHTHQTKPAAEPTFQGTVEIQGWETGSDISRVIPSEIVRLSDPQIEYCFYKEMIDEQLLISEYRSWGSTAPDNRSQRSTGQPPPAHRPPFSNNPPPHQPQSKGPVIICLDTSGSMTGTPELVAKALTLAFINVCQKEGRALFLVLFSTEVVELDLSNVQASLRKLSTFMALEFRGGTDIRPALRQSLRAIRSGGFHNADLLIISDFKIPKVMLGENTTLNTVREHCRIHALTIGRSPIVDEFNIFDSQWHYRISAGNKGIGMVGKEFL